MGQRPTRTSGVGFRIAKQRSQRNSGGEKRSSESISKPCMMALGLGSKSIANKADALTQNARRHSTSAQRHKGTQRVQNNRLDSLRICVRNRLTANRG